MHWCNGFNILARCGLNNEWYWTETEGSIVRYPDSKTWKCIIYEFVHFIIIHGLYIRSIQCTNEVYFLPCARIHLSNKTAHSVRCRHELFAGESRRKYCAKRCSQTLPAARNDWCYAKYNGRVKAPCTRYFAGNAPFASWNARGELVLTRSRTCHSVLKAPIFAGGGHVDLTRLYISGVVSGRAGPAGPRG